MMMAAMVLCPSCDIDEPSSHEDDKKEEIEVTFHPSLDQEPETRAIGDAGKIDQLRAAVYEDNQGSLSHVQTLTESWNDVREKGVSLKLSADKTYRIVFWAEDKDNTAYAFSADGSLKCDYSDYLTGGFARMEELDTFFTTATVGGDTQDGAQERIVLKRPVAMLNFADTTMPQKGTHSVKVTFHSIPTSFNPFTGAVKSTDPIDSSDDIIFTFNDFTNETLTIGGSTYNYLSCNYIFAPTGNFSEAACTVEFLKEGTVITGSEFIGKKAVTLEQNKKSNMLIPMLNMDKDWSVWNGMFPIGSTLTTDPDDPDCYIIDDAEDLAWLSDPTHKSLIGTDKTFRLMADIDMAHRQGQMSLKLPDGSTFDGNGHTIKGLELMVGLFGDKATDLQVRNLTVNDANIKNTTDSHAGILVSQLYGSSTISNVTVSNSSISTLDGAAGGMVGYISRRIKTDRSEPLKVTFDNCHLINTSINGTGKEGYFVGMFRGYDHGETLLFKDNCSCTPASGSEALNSTYIDGEECLWLADNDYSAYNAWLGAEECYRGVIMYGDTRFVARWDGETKVRPLTADPEYDDTPDFKVEAGPTNLVIYSAYDLAGVSTKATSTPKAMYFMTDVDMNGAGKDGINYVAPEFPSACESSDDNYFIPIHSVDYLDGNGHTVFNMSLLKNENRAAYFIRKTSSESHTVHKNLIFRNAHAVVPVEEYVDGNGTRQDMSNGTIFIWHPNNSFSQATSSYTMENIHVYDSKVYAIQAIGILASHFLGDMKDCSVNDCYIENYECENNLEMFSHSAKIAGGFVHLECGFYSYGEVGGLCGLVYDDCSITNCHVRGTTIRAYGQNDKEAKITGEGVLGSIAASVADGAGFFLVPGRHVSTLIGDIRTINGGTVTVTGCTVDDKTKCIPLQYRHNNSVPYIGQAYYIQFLDPEGGKVIVDGNPLTLADCNRLTKR